jgi:arylsulfatase A
MRLLVTCVVLALANVTSPIFAAEKPNIIYVLCDDLGTGDLKCLNPSGKIATPNFDRLAADGMIFTDAHSGSAVCSPTRYGVLTGRYSWRTKLQQGVLGGLSPPMIEEGRLTVPQMLKQQGYHTVAIGKWHLGLNWVKQPGKEVSELSVETPEQVWSVDFKKPYSGGPTAVGFDEYFGISASLDMVPYTFLRNDRVTIVPTIEKQFPMMLGREGGATRLGPAAADFEAEHVLPALTTEAVNSIRQRAADAQAGKPFFLYLPLASPHTPIATTAAWRGKSGLNPYADFVMQTDDALGQILRALDQQGLSQNTLVIVTSDNGCSPQAKFEELLPLGHNPNHVYRGNKADIYEGGHRVPFLVRWPGHVRPGSKSEQTICLTDLLATAADILDVELPATAGEDSVSILPALLGAVDRPLREATVHHSIAGAFAIRQGNWKLCLCPGSAGWSAPRPDRDDTGGLPPIQLFDLSTDIGEQHNIQNQQPEIVKRLTSLLEQYAANGRSTPGAPQQNAVAVDVHRGERPAARPAKAKAAKAKAAKVKASQQ